MSKNVKKAVSEEMIEKSLEEILITKEEKMLLAAQKIEKDFLKNLVELRKEKKITQDEMVKKTGLSQQQISKLENGTREPTLLTLIRYLLGLDIDINELLED